MDGLKTQTTEKVNAKIYTYRIGVAEIGSENLLLLLYYNLVQTNLMGTLLFSKLPSL